MTKHGPRFLATALLWCLALASAASAGAAPVLELDEVLESVEAQYPPTLAALIERDIAAGRLTSAESAFDFNLFARVFGTPAGYYESATLDSGFEQFTGIWGATVFGGYRITRGETLPDYYDYRTQDGGEPRLGVKIPLLRGGAIDERRAKLAKARIDQALADPYIQRQRLDFVRAATVAYYNWLAEGQRLRVAESLLRVAAERNGAIAEQAASGLVPDIYVTDNRRLVVSREIGVVKARRRFEAAALALSMFLRAADDGPLVAGRERLPEQLPSVTAPDRNRLEADIDEALVRRPEARRYDLALEKLDVDQQLARNQALPNLDVGVTASQGVGEEAYKDRGDFELKAGLELRVPLQRREAKGRMAEVDSRIAQVRLERRFAQDRIRNEVRDAFSALQAAWEQTRHADLNVELARELQAGEFERFRRGATDLLALQLREQAAFDAEVLAVDTITEYYRALADYQAATATAAR
jgi:outer membrane protein TolC